MSLPVLYRALSTAISTLIDPRGVLKGLMHHIMWVNGQRHMQPHEFLLVTGPTRVDE